MAGWTDPQTGVYYSKGPPDPNGPPDDPKNDISGSMFGQKYNLGAKGNGQNTGPGDPNSDLNREQLGGQATYWDPTTKQWVAGSAAQIAGRLQGLGGQWAGYQGPTIDYSQTNTDRTRQGEARNAPGMPSQYDAVAAQKAAIQNQQAAYGLWQQEATANPQNSIAAMQARQALGQSLNDQMAAAASARGGPGAQALASRAAMQQGAQLQGQVAGQSAIAAAQERQAALSGMTNAAGGITNAAMGYQQGITGIRGQDINQEQLSAQQAQFQGQMQLGGAELAQKGQLGFEQLGLNSQEAQTQAQLGAQGLGVQLTSAQMGVGMQQQQQNLATGTTIAEGVGAGAAAF